MKFCEFWSYEKVLAHHIFTERAGHPLLHHREGICPRRCRPAPHPLPGLHRVSGNQVTFREASKMKITDKIIASIDKKLERFDPIWQAEHGVGGQRSRYYDKTGVAKWREWRGVKDTMVDYVAWLNNLLAHGKDGRLRSHPLPQGLLGIPLDGFLPRHLHVHRPSVRGLPRLRAEDRSHEHARHRPEPDQARSRSSSQTTSVSAAARCSDDYGSHGRGPAPAVS